MTACSIEKNRGPHSPVRDEDCEPAWRQLETLYSSERRRDTEEEGRREVSMAGRHAHTHTLGRVVTLVPARAHVWLKEQATLRVEEETAALPDTPGASISSTTGAPLGGCSKSQKLTSVSRLIKLEGIFNSLHTHTGKANTNSSTVQIVLAWIYHSALW